MYKNSSNSQLYIIQIKLDTLKYPIELLIYRLINIFFVKYNNRHTYLFDIVSIWYFKNKSKIHTYIYNTRMSKIYLQNNRILYELFIVSKKSIVCYKITKEKLREHTRTVYVAHTHTHADTM